MLIKQTCRLLRSTASNAVPKLHAILHQKLLQGRFASTDVVEFGAHGKVHCTHGVMVPFE